MTSLNSTRPNVHAQIPLPSLLRGRTWRPGLAGLLLIGLALLLAASAAGNAYLYLSLPITHHVANLSGDFNGDGVPDLLVSGEVVYGTRPLASTAAASGQ